MRNWKTARSFLLTVLLSFCGAYGCERGCSHPPERASWMALCCACFMVSLQRIAYAAADDIGKAKAEEKEKRR
jgi:hypothetical protein